MPTVASKLIKERLEKIKRAGSSAEDKKDWSKIMFKPIVGKQKIRLVEAFHYDSENQIVYPLGPTFAEVTLHSYNAFKKPIYALTNFGEKDPIVELRKKLFATKDESDEAVAKKIAPRKRIFAQVIVRGQEDMGVRLWEFGNSTYEKILSIMDNSEEYGDIFDLQEGTDLIVEGIETAMKATSKKYVDVTITPSRKTSPLSDDPKQVEAWLQEQHDPMSLYKKYSFEEIKEILTEFLNPEDDDVEEEEEETPAPKKSKVQFGAKKKAPVVEEDDDDDDDEDEKPAPKKTSKKTSKKEVEEEDEFEEEEEAPKKPTRKPVAEKTTSKKTSKKEVEEEDEEFEEEETPKKTSSKKPSSNTKTSSTKKKFDEVFKDDDDEFEDDEE